MSRLAVRALLALVVASTMLRGGPVTAQTAPGLVGVKGSASASGVNALYNPAGLLPIAAPVDLGAPDALATMSNGPATFARASVADPGDILANPDALLSQSGPSYKPGTVPAYPYRVQASSGVGEPSAENAPAPGLNARVHADQKGSQAQATMPALSGPSVLTAGSLTSWATTATDGATVTVRAHSEIQNVDLLGIVKIGSIVTDLVAEGDGEDVELTGGTTVTNASVSGQPVVIDANGVQPSGYPPGLPNPVFVALNEVLSQAGIRITVAAPVSQEGDTAGQLIAAGVRIDLEVSDRTYPVLATLRGLVPPLESPVPGAPSIEDVLAATTARHLFAVGLGRGAVSLTARLPSPAVTETPFSSEGTTASGGFVPAPRQPGAPAPPSLEAAAPAATPIEVNGVGLGEGVGLVALLAMLLQPLLGDRLVRATTALLADDHVTACPREGR